MVDFCDHCVVEFYLRPVNPEIARLTPQEAVYYPHISSRKRLSRMLICNHGFGLRRAERNQLFRGGLALALSRMRGESFAR
jgi:hypothetical protein